MKKALKRTLALVLAVCLCLAMVPAAMAAQPMEPGDIDMSIRATEKSGGYTVKYTASIVMVDWLAKPAALNCADDKMADLEFVCTLKDDLVDQLTSVDEDDFSFTSAKWDGKEIFVFEEASTVAGGIEIRYSLNRDVLRAWKDNTIPTEDVYKALTQKMTMTATKSVTDAQFKAAGNGYTSHATIELEGSTIEFYFDERIVLGHEGTAKVSVVEAGSAGGGKPSLIADHVAYIIGYEDGTVRPENNITRAEVATIFFRLLTDESRDAFWSTSNSYNDVERTDWFNNAISTLSNADIITGYPDGTFKPNASITRAEFAAISVRFSDVVYTQNSSFTDVDASHWAAKYISLAEYLGWVNGYPDGTFRPNNLITRAESMTLINRVLEREVEAKNMLAGMRTWPDNAKSAWYYEAVQEATNSHTYERLDREVPGRGFNYEKWLKLVEDPDWKALEYSWSEANDH